MEHVGALVDIIKTLDIDFETVTRICQLCQDWLGLCGPFPDERRLVHSIHLQIMEPGVPLTSSLLRLVRARGDKRYAFMDRLRVKAQPRPCGDGAGHSLNIQPGSGADELYIHRNTLTYRLSKYTKETQGSACNTLTDLIVSWPWNMG